MKVYEAISFSLPLRPSVEVTPALMPELQQAVLLEHWSGSG